MIPTPSTPSPNNAAIQGNAPNLRGKDLNFKSFLRMSRDLKVNLFWIATRYVVMVKVRKDVGITRQFPHYSYTVGPYGKGPTSDYTTCT